MKLLSNFSPSQKKQVALLLAVVFLVGFFLGREQIKYQIRSSLQQAFSGIGGGSDFFENSDKGPALDSQTQKKKAEEQPLSIALLKKDIEKAGYIDVIAFKIEITNNLDKDIKAFIGTVIFYDLFEREIMPVTITYEDGVAKGGKAIWEGSIDYNQFMDTHQRLASVAFENLSITSEIEQVIFADGSKQNY